ncbi:MAG: dodecin family protein [Bradymonadaceae bacterium]|nr:dodecin family protein [Lujinxingiaceae bacterium]
MSNHVYKIVRLAGSSPDGVEKAIENALSKASESLRNIRWFTVEETRGQVDDGKIAHYQVVLSVGFTLE